MLKGSLLELTDEEMFSLIDCPEELNDVVKKKNRWPRPRFEVGGRRYLVLQDQEHERKGSIFVPEEYRKRHQSTSGIILQVGDGYEEGLGEHWQDWQPPYGVGARIAWGKYNHTVTEIDVHKEWWTAEELSKIPPDLRKVEFIIINTHQVYGKLL